MSFISKRAFTEQAKITREESQVSNWVDIPTNGEIYKVNSIDEKEGKFGPCFIITIESDRGEKSKLWSPRKLASIIQENPSKTVFFCSLGQTLINGKRRNNFDFVLR